MTSPILDALPAIHTTVIGFGGAFFSAFALYAYQKVQETKDQLEKVLKEVETFSTPTNYVGTSQADFLLESGELDWDGKAKRILQEAKSYFSFLDYEEKYGIPRDAHMREPSDEQVISACRTLCFTLHYVFVSYPFSGKSMVHVQGETEKLEKRKQEPFDEKRLREIERRIGFLRWCWDTNNRSILELARRCALAEQGQAHQQQQASFEANTAKHEPASASERERIWKTFHLPHISHSIDYGQIVADYFNKVLAYQNNVLPALRESLRVHDLYNERFQVKKLSLWMIGLTIVILALGVFLPPTMQSVCTDFAVCWHPAIQYLLLAGTAAPYFLVCSWLYRKVQKSSFR